MWQVVGQSRAVSLLQRSLEQGALSHAYLSVGPPHVGKMTLALNLAQALNCEAAEPPCNECATCQKIASQKHADVQIIGLSQNGNSTEDKLRTEISIDQIREVQHSASLPPFEGKYRIYIIDGAEQLSTEAANSLLKTLEEPTGKVVFILLARSEKSLPATVVSRCQRLELLPLATSKTESAIKAGWGIDTQKAEFLARICHGCLGWAVSALRDDSLLQQRGERLERVLDIITADYEQRFSYASQLASQFSHNRETVQEILDTWLDYWRDLLLIRAGCPDTVSNIDLKAGLFDMAKGYSLAQVRDFINTIQTTRENLRQNANPQLALEVLMLSIPRRGGCSEEKVTALNHG